MKVKELIAQLQKFDPELPVFTSHLFDISLSCPTPRLIKYEKGKKGHIMYTGETPGGFEIKQLDCYREKAMNTKHQKAVIFGGGLFKNQKIKTGTPNKDLSMTGYL